MKIARSMEELSFAALPSVVTIGNFDGVHRGHRAVIRQVVTRARELGAQSVVITFDPHPAVVLGKSKDLKLITPLSQKLELLSGTEIDLVLVLPFTEVMSRWSAREFSQRVLCEGLRAIEVHEGENFRFGYGAEAGVAGLSDLGKEFSFSVCATEPYLVRGAPISSSRIRKEIVGGRVQNARALLGRPFAVQSTPASGRGYGTRYAVPTINLAPYHDLLPSNGVYVSTLRVGARPLAPIFQAVTNVGNRPTFGADSFAVESHLFDFKPLELRAETPLELTFLHRLREERRFESTDALKEQISKDIRWAQRFFALASVLDARTS